VRGLCDGLRVSTHRPAGPAFERVKEFKIGWIRAERSCRGRDAHYCAAPAQIPACGIPAPGSCLRSAVVPIGVWATHAIAQPDQATGGTRNPALCPVRVLPTGLPSTRCLPSIPSAADRPALFGDFLGVESGEVGLIALPPPARSNGSCSFPASRFPMWVALVGEGWVVFQGRGGSAARGRSLR
jgi:hypothetical protein